MLHSSAKSIRFCKNEVPHNAQTTAARQRSNVTTIAQLLRSSRKPNLFPRKGDHPARRWIVLPCVTKCNRVVKFFLQIVYIVSREGPGNGARGACCAS